MYIKSKEDLDNLRIDANAFNSYYMSNGGCSTCLMKGGGEIEDKPSNLNAKEFMDYYLPILRGGYRKVKEVKRKKRKTRGGNTVEANNASNNFFHLISSTPGINHSSYPDLKFNSYSFPDSQLPQFR
jgi:hypothetical protein